MPVICEVHKELYVPSPEPRVGVSVSMTYIGEGRRREETRALVRSSDWGDTVRRRSSPDNGRTWSEWELVYEQAPTQGNWTQSGGPGPGGTGPLDPVSGRLLKPVFQRLVRGDPREAMSVLWQGDRRFCDHGFYQVSADDGRTWGEGHLLRYEDGPDFDPGDWGSAAFFRTNEMYIGRAIATARGTVVISATIPVEHRDPEDEKVKSVFPNTYREGCVAGVMCFVGRWDAGREDYDWQTSNRIFLPRRQSTRGLVELDLSELRDGRLLLLMRGSNTGLEPRQCPARKWMSVSADGGLTWSPVRDIRYDTGEPLYSPASISHSLRSRKTGKLYWAGNIPDVPPDGNGPRYPLQIVEVDEDAAVPAFRRDTVTIIDDRDPTRDSEHLQLSNFSLLEDRETGEMEVYLVRLGERGGGPDVWTADAYRYRLVF
ncbi:MAG: sialidase family protein [Gemmatimonadota bacterium]